MMREKSSTTVIASQRRRKENMCFASATNFQHSHIRWFIWLPSRRWSTIKARNGIRTYCIDINWNVLGVNAWITEGKVNDNNPLIPNWSLIPDLYKWEWRLSLKGVLQYCDEIVILSTEALPWRVKLSDVKQSKITKGPVLAGRQVGGKKG